VLNHIASRFSTVGLRGEQCARAWQDCMLDVYFPLVSIPERPDQFVGRVVTLDLSAVALSHYSADALQSVRYANQAEEEEFILFFPTAQRQKVCQYQLEREVGPGEVVVFNTAKQYSTRLPDKTRCLAVRIKADALRNRVPNIDDVYLRQHSVNTRLLSVVVNFASEIISQTAESDAPLLEKAGQNLFELICLMFLMNGAQGTATRGQVESNAGPLILFYDEKLKGYIRNHFRRHDLSPEVAATAINISTRYVHKIFKTKGTTFGQELMKLRLLEADRMLRQPLDSNSRSLQIAEIAYSCGFSSQSHFSSRYKEHFGCTPRTARLNF
jgi:AraC family transcriptional activator of tynA and feaB